MHINNIFSNVDYVKQPVHWRKLCCEHSVFVNDNILITYFKDTFRYTVSYYILMC